jgi:membrane-associated HD superfamily phosphohydrolase
MIEPIIQLFFVAPLVSQPLSIGILSGVWDLIGGFIPLVIGILIIILVVGLAIIVLPAIIVAAVVWFLTGSFFYAGIAFLVVAVVSIAAK